MTRMSTLGNVDTGQTKTGTKPKIGGGGGSAKMETPRRRHALLKLAVHRLPSPTAARFPGPTTLG